MTTPYQREHKRKTKETVSSPSSPPEAVCRARGWLCDACFACGIEGHDCHLVMRKHEDYIHMSCELAHPTLARHARVR